THALRPPAAVGHYACFHQRCQLHIRSKDHGFDERASSPLWSARFRGESRHLVPPPKRSMTKDDYKTSALFTGIMLLAFVLRVYHLGTSSLWFDEILTVYDAMAPFSKIHRIVLASPPLFHYLIRAMLLV